MSSLKLKIKAILTQCGEGGIRTLEGLAPLPLFESGTFNHSATSPTSFLFCQHQHYKSDNHQNK